MTEREQEGAVENTLYAMIGRHVKRLRGGREWTQADLGEALVAAGIPAKRPRQLAYMIESGTRHLDAVDLVLLAQVLNTSVPELLEPIRDDHGDPLPGDLELPGTSKAKGAGKGKPVKLSATDLDDLVFQRFYTKVYTFAQIWVMDRMGATDAIKHGEWRDGGPGSSLPPARARKGQR